MRVSDLNLPPPSCLANVRATRATGNLREQFVADFISKRDELEVWAVGCTCGEDKGKIFGVREYDEFSPPIFYACTACSRRELIFDPSLHGWNAEISKRKRKAKKAPNATFAMHCRSCKTTVWRPAVLVTYQGDLSGPDENTTMQPLENYFDVIVIGGECVNCGAVASPYGDECA